MYFITVYFEGVRNSHYFFSASMFEYRQSLRQQANIYRMCVSCIISIYPFITHIYVSDRQKVDRYVGKPLDILNYIDKLV